MQMAPKAAGDKLSGPCVLPCCPCYSTPTGARRAAPAFARATPDRPPLALLSARTLPDGMSLPRAHVQVA